jgi:Rps23 Pro-64 3,4-dihydroxylase Tpa1-like proline 4-hydroxylase
MSNLFPRLGKNSVESLQKVYSRATPFPHIVLHDICDDTELRSVLDELKQNLKATFKETDLFKVFQTSDLSGFVPATSKTSKLIDLRDSLYSARMRGIIRKITGCSELSSRVDCSCNIYPCGGQLLCHDDVIGTRCVTFIIYLVDPDDIWESKDGGGLELYDTKQDTGEPEIEPVTVHVPTWNSMMIFEVKSGITFHAVQEVRANNKPRISISGWFHSNKFPENMDASTLTQLKSHAQLKATKKLEIINIRKTETLIRKSELSFLKKWINKEYLKSSSMRSIWNAFSNHGSIQLKDFLCPYYAQCLNDLLLSESVDNNESPENIYLSGICDGWESVGPPHKQRYLLLDTSSEHRSELGRLLSKISMNLFQSIPFQNFFSEVTGKCLSCQSSRIRKFRPGLDYTVAHNESIGDFISATLCFVRNVDSEKIAWSSGNYGGFECYIQNSNTEFSSLSEVYDVNSDSNEISSVDASFNTLTIVNMKEGMLRFIKYVSHMASSSRFDICSDFY